MQRYTKAVALKEDSPDYLLAAGRMACTLADYDRAQEWLTKMPNGMSNDQIFNFIDLSIRLLHDTGKYREMSILMIFNMGLKSLLQRKSDWKTGLENILWIAIPIAMSSLEGSAEMDLLRTAFSYFDLSSPEILVELVAFMNHLNLFDPERSPELNVVIKNLDSGLEKVGYSPQAFLRGMEKRLGQDHPKLAQFCNNFAVFYLLQRDYEKADPLIQRALQIKEKTLGKNHPSTAITLNTLALMYRLQERYDEAESLYQRSFEIVNTSFGKDHPQVAAALNNLAELYKIQGRDEEANSLYQRSAAIQEAGNNKKTTALFQHVIKILSNNFDQARYDDLRRKITEQAVAEP